MITNEFDAMLEKIRSTLKELNFDFQDMKVHPEKYFDNVSLSRIYRITEEIRRLEVQIYDYNEKILSLFQKYHQKLEMVEVSDYEQLFFYKRGMATEIYIFVSETKKKIVFAKKTGLEHWDKLLWREFRELPYHETYLQLLNFSKSYFEELGVWGFLGGDTRYPVRETDAKSQILINENLIKKELGVFRLIDGWWGTKERFPPIPMPLDITKFEENSLEVHPFYANIDSE